MSTTQQHSPVAVAGPSATRSSLKQWIVRHPVLAYLFLAYGVSWAIFLIPLLSRSGIGVLAFDAPYRGCRSRRAPDSRVAQIKRQADRRT